MLKLTAFEFILRAIPEGFIFILASYALANRKINMNRYIISSLLASICVYLIRVFPINYGVHTILNFIVQTVILVNINKIDIIPAIKSAIITFIFLFISELLNMLALSYIFKDDLETMLSDEILKTLCGLPSLILFGIFAVCYYKLSKKDDILNV